MFGEREFDPYGSTSDEFLDLFWTGIEDAIDEDFFNEDRLYVPANPDPRYKKVIVVKHAARTVPALVPATYRVGDNASGVTFSVWCVPCVDSEVMGANGKPKQLNLFRMVRNAYAAALKGSVSEVMPNPYFFGRGAFNAEVSLLSTMRARLKEAEMWGGDRTMGVEFASAGGSSGSVAAREAKRQNAAKARAAKAAKQRQRDHEILCAANLGFSIPDLAAKYSLTEQNVRAAVERAKTVMA